MSYFAKVDIDYEMPNCPTCGSKQTINRIDITTTDKLLNAKANFVMICEDGTCEGGVIQDQKYGFYNPDTHRIHKKPVSKKKVLLNG